MLHLQAQDLTFSQYFTSDRHEKACPNLWEVLMKIHQTANLTAGILFTLILGTLLHFCYDWSGHNPFAALFLPINESVWEHLKMLFFPALIYTLFEVFVLSKTSARFLSARTLGMVLGMFFIVSSFDCFNISLSDKISFIEIPGNSVLAPCFLSLFHRHISSKVFRNLSHILSIYFIVVLQAMTGMFAQIVVMGNLIFFKRPQKSLRRFKWLNFIIFSICLEIWNK